MSEGRPAKARTRRGYRGVRAVDPDSGQETTAFVSYDKIDATARFRSRGQVLELAHLVPDALARPQAVFRGVREEAERRWLCYVGRRSRAFHPDGTERTPYPGEVFLVFVTDQMVVYNWNWFEADEQDAALPRDHADRFSERLL